MNATRAATIRLRSSFDGAVSLGRVQTPTLAIVARREEEIRAFKPEPYWLVDATFEPVGGDRRAATGPLPRGRPAAAEDRRGGRGDRRRRPRPATGEITKLEKTTQEGARAAPLRPHVAPARREHALRLLGPAHAGRRPAPLRGAQGAHLPAHELALPVRRHGRRDQADRRPTSASTREYATRREVRAGLDVLPLGRVVNDAKVTDHHAIIPTLRAPPRRQDVRRRPAHLRHGRPALPRRLPPGRGVREHAPGDDRRGARLPHARPRPARARLARRLRRGRRSRRARRLRRGRPTSSCPSSSAARPSTTLEVAAAEKETKPPRRYSDASLLGGDGDRRQARRRRRAARGDEGLRASARRPRARRSSSA